MLLEVVVLFRDRWRRLSPRDRARLAELVRRSRGRPGNLTPREREELRRLAGELDLAGVGRDVVSPAPRLRRR